MFRVQASGLRVQGFLLSGPEVFCSCFLGSGGGGGGLKNECLGLLKTQQLRLDFASGSLRGSQGS